MKNQDVRVVLNQGVGGSHVYIGGEEVNRVRSVTVHQTAGEIATVTLELIPDKIEITGITDCIRKYATVDVID